MVIVNFKVVMVVELLARPYFVITFIFIVDKIIIIFDFIAAVAIIMSLVEVNYSNNYYLCLFFLLF